MKPDYSTAAYLMATQGATIRRPNTVYSQILDNHEPSWAQLRVWELERNIIKWRMRRNIVINTILFLITAALMLVANYYVLVVITPYVYGIESLAGMVVRWLRPLTAPDKPSSPISRCTVPALTSIPCRCK